MEVVTTTTTPRLPGGQLGNRNAAHSKPLTDILRSVLAEDDHEKLRLGMRAVYALASQGDITALGFIMDRIDGKPKQAVDVSGDALAPVVVVQRPQITRDEWLRIHSVPAPVPAIEAPRNDGDK